MAITQVLLGFRGLILTRVKVKLYLPTVIWAELALLNCHSGVVGEFRPENAR
jgi:hypothetical protein